MYRFQQEKIQLPTLSPMKLKYELTISPSTQIGEVFPTDFGVQSHVQITPSIIVERINCFRRALFNIVKIHHRVIFEILLKFFSTISYLRIFFPKNFN